MHKRLLTKIRRSLSLRSKRWDKLPCWYHRNPAMRQARPSKGSRRRWRRRYSG